MGSSHVRRLTCAQSKCKILWKSIYVSLDRLIQNFGRHAVQVCEIEVDDHALATNREDQRLQSLICVAPLYLLRHAA